MDTPPSGVDSVAQSPSQLFGESADGVETSLPASTGRGDVQRSPRLQDSSATGENVPSQSQTPTQSSGKTPSHPDGKSPKKADSKNSSRSNKSDPSNNANSPNDPNNKNVNKASSKDGGPKTTAKPNWSPKEVNGRRVYQRNDLFDPNAVDANGMTNLERMKKGRPPIGHDGEAVNLHHLTQNEPGSLAEVGGNFHSGNSKTLHGLTEPKRSFRYSPDGKTTEAEKAFRRYSYKYWQDRAKGF